MDSPFLSQLTKLHFSTSLQLQVCISESLWIVKHRGVVCLVWVMTPKIDIRLAMAKPLGQGFDTPTAQNKCMLTKLSSMANHRKSSAALTEAKLQCMDLSLMAAISTEAVLRVPDFDPQVACVIVYTKAIPTQTHIHTHTQKLTQTQTHTHADRHTHTHTS